METEKLSEVIKRLLIVSGITAGLLVIFSLLAWIFPKGSIPEGLCILMAASSFVTTFILLGIAMVSWIKEAVPSSERSRW